MVDLWQVLRATWLVGLPAEQPNGVGIRKEQLHRGDVLRLEPEQLAVVLSGAITDRVSNADGKVGVIRRYSARDPILMPVGYLRTERHCEVLVLLDGWQSALPEAAALAQMLIAAELLDTKRRLASVMIDQASVRIRAHLLAESIDPARASPTVISQYVGCSRERASAVLGRLARGEQA